MRSLLTSAAFLTAAIAAPAAAQDHPWPTTDFEVRVGLPPNMEDPNAAGPLHVDVPLEARIKVEAWLKEVAEYLQAEGFRPPHLDVEPSQYSPPKPNGVYVVRAYNMPRDNTALYHGHCRELGSGDGDSSHIVIDTFFAQHSGTDQELAIVDGDLTDSGEATLAHELFHAVQFSYPLFREPTCSAGTWIQEGTAEAAKVHIIEELRGRTYTGPAPEYEQSLLPRNYSSQLWIGPYEGSNASDDAYDTGSFWLYLAEMSAVGRGEIPELANDKRDISYLDEIFEIGRAGSGRAAELTWLKDALAIKFRRRLPGVFSEFVTLFAGYVPARAGLDGDVESWRGDLFEQCIPKELTRSAPRADITLGFAPVSARCVGVSMDTTDEVELFVFARNRGEHLNDAEALKNVFVGVPGTHVVDRADLTLPGDIAAEGEDVVAMWRVPFDPVVDDALVLSSIATIKPDDPHNGPIAFTILHPEWRSSLTRKPDRPPPAPRGEGERGELNEEKADATARATAHLDTFSTTSRSSARVSRDPDRPSCEEPFKFQVCGPHMTVSLEVTPGSMFDMGATSGRGGNFAQLAGNLIATDRAAGPGMAGLFEWVERQEAIPGHKISMTFPMVDYGFTGSFDNALIEARIDGETMWRTVGPEDAMPGPGRNYAFSGTVTIEEYSPELLRGTYSGGLVDGADGVDAGDNPTLPIKHALSGSFVVAAPLLDDDRTRVVHPSEYGGIGEDMEIFMPGVGAPLEDILEQVLAEAADNPALDYSPDASVGELCDCSCNYVETASPVCRDHCAFTYLACEGRAFTPPAMPAAMTETEEAAALADLRARFETFLVETRGENAADTQLQIFDSLDMPYEETKLWLEAGDPTGFVAWEREKSGLPDPKDYVPSEDEAARIAKLREDFHRHLLATKTEWQADNIIQFYDEEAAGSFEDRLAWIVRLEPGFENTRAE